MDMQLLFIFIIFNILNVIIQTIKNIVTIKCGKGISAIVNAVAYGLYTYIVILTATEGIGLLAKCLIVAACNFVGVYAVKWAEEKARKDKLWKVEATIHNYGTDPDWDDCIIALKDAGIPFNYIDVQKYLLINCYCATQAESAKVKQILDQHNAKYFVSESKTL